MMQQGVVLMRVPEQWDQALLLFDRMVALAPTFAEVGAQHGAVAPGTVCAVARRCAAWWHVAAGSRLPLLPS